MTRLALALRLLLLACFLLIAVPVQMMALRLGWRLAATVPVIFHRLLLWTLDIRLHVIGPPPGGAPTLVLANHASWLDIPVIGSLQSLSFVAKSEIAGWPIFGFLAGLQRTVYIERARRSATAEVNRTVAERLARGEAVVLFPEGTTSDGNRVLPFRSSLVGAARAALADETLDHIHLQPLALAYTRRNGLPVTRRERPGIAWYGDMDLLPHLGAFLREGPLDVEVRWGAPIPFDALSDRKQAARIAERVVREAVSGAMRGRIPAR